MRFRVTSRKSQLYHTGAIEQRFAEAIEHRLGKASTIEPARLDDEDESSSVACSTVRDSRRSSDAFTVSADSSGALLHQRGYRQAVAKAPLRETLAAAMLIVSDWSGATPLVDPFCGSGTIPIEAAPYSRGAWRRDSGGPLRFIPGPKLNRRYGRSCAKKRQSEALPRSASRDPGIRSRSQAQSRPRSRTPRRAGVAADIEFSVRAMSAIETLHDATGLVVTNPPYGVRVGEAAKLRDLYARFGQVLRAKFPGWELALLSANPRLESELRLALSERLRTRNGGIPVRVLMARVPDVASR